MTMTEQFAPRWASPPGDTIGSALAELRMTVEGLAESLKVETSTAAGLLDGSTHVSLGIARGLSEAFGGSATFWMTREAQYRESLDWMEADRWVSLLPRRDLVRLGWLAPADDWQGWVRECMALFDVDSPSELTDHRARLEEAQFRARPHTAEQEATITAWLGKIQLDAKDMPTQTWNPAAFRRALPALARLSRNPDPTQFIPELQKACAEVGVAIVVARPPRNCPVSGVALVLPTGTRVIGMSGRYLADDHFWFTFFHEAGHLLLHDASSMFVDDIENGPAKQGEHGVEAEADQFASEVLLPSKVRSAIPQHPSPIQVHGLAQRAGVSTGVVVGQLQHEGRLSFRSPLNRLKHRYVWHGTKLSRGSA